MNPANFFGKNFIERVIFRTFAPKNNRNEENETKIFVDYSAAGGLCHAAGTGGKEPSVRGGKEP